MKILDDYKKIANSLFIERASTDKYNTKSFDREDGETWDTAKGRAGKYDGEIKYFNADSADDDAELYAKTGKVQNAVGGDDDKIDDKPKGTKVGDFDRDSGDAPPEAWDVEDEFGGEDSEVAKYLKSLQGKEDDEDEWDDTSMGQRNRSYGGRGFGESVEPKKKPFLKEQLERFGGGKY